MYLKLKGDKVLGMSRQSKDGYEYVNREPTPPPLKIGERAYIYYNEQEGFYYKNEKGEVI